MENYIEDIDTKELTQRQKKRGCPRFTHNTMIFLNLRLSVVKRSFSNLSQEFLLSQEYRYSGRESADSNKDENDES